MVTVIARETFPYAGIIRYKGESFDATDEDARILRLAARIDDSMIVIEPVEVSETPPPKRTYRRRPLPEESSPE